MDFSPTTLPQLSPAQRRPLTPAKSSWSGVSSSWDSERSTAASDASSSGDFDSARQERMMLADADWGSISVSRPSSSPASNGVRSSPPTLFAARGAAHGLIRSASSLLLPPTSLHSGVSPPPAAWPASLPSSANSSQTSSARSKRMLRSATNPCLRQSVSSRRPSRNSSPPSTAAAKLLKPPQRPSSASSRRPSTSASTSTSTVSRNGSASSSRIPSPESASSSRRPSKSSSTKPTGSQRPSSPERPIRREELAARHMLALKALLKELVPSYRSLPELISVLLHNVMAPEGHQAFSKETLKHVCLLVSSGSSAESPIDESAPSQISAFLEDLGHAADEGVADEDQVLSNQAIEVMALLSLRWFATRNLISVPELSDYQRRSWLPPAFSNLVGQVIWRHQKMESLQSHTLVVENLRWITLAPGVEEDMMDRCNLVFRIFSGSDAARMKSSQWRKVMELIASNPELRPRVRRCDAVRACYGNALSYAESGLNRKQFKLMLMKTADLMGVHPLALFQELALRAPSLETAQKAKEETQTVSFFSRPASR